MIIALLLQAIVDMVNYLFTTFTDPVTILPWGVDEPLVYAFSVVRTVVFDIPFLSLPISLLIAFYIYKGARLLLQLFLGQRAPATT